MKGKKTQKIMMNIVSIFFNVNIRFISVIFIVITVYVTLATINFENDLRFMTLKLFSGTVFFCKSDFYSF